MTTKDKWTITIQDPRGYQVIYLADAINIIWNQDLLEFQIEGWIKRDSYKMSVEKEESRP